jgi:hypothetical protein
MADGRRNPGRNAMKKIVLASLSVALAITGAQAQEKGAQKLMQPATNTAIGPIVPPPVYIQTPVYNQTAPPPAAQAQPAPVYVYDQKPVQQQPMLVSQADAQATVEQFRTNYSKLGSPRILIYVNRDLVDDQSGLKLSGRSETVKTVRTTGANSTNGSATTETFAQNNYHNNGTTAKPTLADRQTVRDVERLMGRPLRAAGATLVDQRVASQIIENRPLDSLAQETEQAQKDRAAVNQIADVVLEVLISSRNVTVTEISGDRTYSVPDIQVTAIRLKDSKVVGQAAASDIMNRVGGPAMAARNYSAQDITEATSLALMNDMLQETK